MCDRFVISQLLHYHIIDHFRRDRFCLLASSSSLYSSVSIHSSLAIPGFSAVLMNLLGVPSSGYSRGHPWALHFYECPFSICCGGSLSPHLRGLDRMAQCDVKDGRVRTTQAGGGTKGTTQKRNEVRKLGRKCEIRAGQKGRHASVG